MRIVFDGQLLQSAGFSDESAASAAAFLRAVVADLAGHQVFVILDGNLPSRIGALRAAFGEAMPQRDIRCWYGLDSDPANRAHGWKLRATQLIREGLIASLDADVVVMPVAADAKAEVAGGGLLRGVATLSVAEDWAEAGADARADLLARIAAVRPAVQAVQGKPRLAFVSPLPPERSGISFYSAELLPALAAHYDIELIVDQRRVADGAWRQGLPVRDVAWFRANAGRFDRIVYQVGNSKFHKHMFALLREHPGVVVLHDVFLSGVMADMDRPWRGPHSGAT